MLDENRKRNVINAARQLAESGKFESVVELEATFIMQGHAVDHLQDVSLRAELQMLIENATPPRNSQTK